MSRRCFRLLLTGLKSTNSGSGPPDEEEDPGKVKSAKGRGWLKARLVRKGFSGADSAVSAEFVSVEAISVGAISVGAISLEAMSADVVSLEAVSNGFKPESLCG